MNKTKSRDKRGKQLGATLVEYAIILGLLVMVAAAAVPVLGRKLKGNLEDTGEAILVESS